jgi:hypothetical protein
MLDGNTCVSIYVDRLAKAVRTQHLVIMRVKKIDFNALMSSPNFDEYLEEPEEQSMRFSLWSFLREIFLDLGRNHHK